MNCDDRLIARAADGDPAAGAALNAHLAVCPACRAALDDQRMVAAWLAARPPEAPRAGFAARVAARIDGETAPGVLGLANWRAWGGTLAPLAAALTLAAWFGVGLERDDDLAPVSAESFTTWTRASADDDRAAAFLRPGATPELLIETVLTGTLPREGGDGDVR